MCECVSLGPACVRYVCLEGYGQLSPEGRGKGGLRGVANYTLYTGPVLQRGGERRIEGCGQLLPEGRVEGCGQLLPEGRVEGVANYYKEGMVEGCGQLSSYTINLGQRGGERDVAIYYQRGGEALSSPLRTFPSAVLPLVVSGRIYCLIGTH